MAKPLLRVSNQNFFYEVSSIAWNKIGDRKIVFLNPSKSNKSRVSVKWSFTYKKGIYKTTKSPNVRHWTNHIWLKHFWWYIIATAYKRTMWKAKIIFTNIIYIWTFITTRWLVMNMITWWLISFWFKYAFWNIFGCRYVIRFNSFL